MSYSAEVLQDSPSAYWRFEDNALDETANSYDGTVYGATYVNGLEGRALDFDGVDDYFDAGLLGTFGQSLGTCTVEFILTTTTAASGDSIYGQDQSTATGQFFSMQTNEVRGGAATAGATAIILRDETAVALRAHIEENGLYDGNPHHVAWTINASLPEVLCYVDGVEVFVNDNGQTPSGFVSFDNPLAIGALITGATPSSFADVTIDEFALYPTILTSTRVQAHYNAIGTSESLAKPTSWMLMKTTDVPEITGSWDAVADAVGYSYDVEEWDGTAWQAFAVSSVTAPTTSFTLTESDGITPNTTYRARVKATS